MDSRRTRAGALLAAALLLFALFFWAIYHGDNKYTRPGAQPIAGLLSITGEEAAAHPLRFLIRDWEYYPGVLLSPADFAHAAPGAYRQYVSVGQYGGLEAGNPLRSPHGRGSYRLTLSLPEPARDWAIELPAVYSAWRLYIDGRLAAQMGDPGPETYTPRIGDRTVVFSGAGQVSLLLAVSDYSSFYGGMTYPPAFGPPAAVDAQRQARLFFRMAVLLLGLGAGALALFLGLRFRARRGFLFALTCLAMAGCTSYPLLHALFPVPPQPGNTLGLAFLYGAFLLAGALAADLCGLAGAARYCPLAFLGGFVLLAALYGALAPLLPLWAMQGFSALTDAVKIAFAVWLFTAAGLAFHRGKARSPLLLGGAAFFAEGLLCDRLWPLYEPVVGGWFTEWGVIGLVLSLGCALWLDLVGAYRFRLTFEGEQRQMRRQLEMQREHYRQLTTQIEETRAARHDLRHHLRAVKALAESGDLAGVRGYLAGGLLTVPEGGVLRYSGNYAADAILRYYAADAGQKGISFSAELALPQELPFPADELGLILGNLLENAVEACARQKGAGRSILVRGDLADGRLRLVVRNTFDGELHRERGRFLSSKREGCGMGLRSVQAVAERRGGICDFGPQDGQFQASVLIPIGGDPGDSTHFGQKNRRSAHSP